RGAFDRGDGSGPSLVWPHMAASEVSLAKDLTIERLGEHKNRVLSATDDWQAVEVARSHPSEKKIDTWEDPASWDAHQVVAVGNDSAQSTQDDMIKEVVSTDGRADGFHHPGDSKVAEEQDGQGMDEKELQDASEVEHKDGSDASENNIAGTHPAANLTSSLEKV
uniref:Uncharacterized protein n=1 Tax=Aegilops tauschii subsp. strangulata TaxID=200361 RepID=A0A453L2Z5_AEGTS